MKKNHLSQSEKSYRSRERLLHAFQIFMISLDILCVLYLAYMIYIFYNT